MTEQILALVIKPYEERIKVLEEQVEVLRAIERGFSSFLQLKDLHTALAKAQGEFEVAYKNCSNPYFKSRYADLEELKRVSVPSLSKYGLSVTQEPTIAADGSSSILTVIRHSSGQFIDCTMRVVPSKNDIQTISSYMSYVKRICYSSLVGVVARDEDDDGEAAVATDRQVFAKGTALNTKYNPKDQSPEVVTREQLDELEYELAEYPDIAEMVLDGLKINSLADMPKNKYMASVQRIREIKNARNGVK